MVGLGHGGIGRIGGGGVEVATDDPSVGEISAVGHGGFEGSGFFGAPPSLIRTKGKVSREQRQDPHRGGDASPSGFARKSACGGSFVGGDGESLGFKDGVAAQKADAFVKRSAIVLADVGL